MLAGVLHQFCETVFLLGTLWVGAGVIGGSFSWVSQAGGPFAVRVDDVGNVFRLGRLWEEEGRDCFWEYDANRGDYDGVGGSQVS